MFETACADEGKSHGIVEFKWVNCMMCELYLNKAVKKTTEKSWNFNTSHTAFYER